MKGWEWFLINVAACLRGALRFGWIIISCEEESSEVAVIQVLHWSEVGTHLRHGGAFMSSAKLHCPQKDREYRTTKYLCGNSID